MDDTLETPILSIVFTNIDELEGVGQSIALLRPGHSRYTVACCCPYCKCSKRDNAQSKQITSTALDFSLPYKRFGCLVMTFLKNHRVETMHTLEH